MDAFSDNNRAPSGRAKGRRVRLMSGVSTSALATALLLLTGGCFDDSGTNPVPTALASDESGDDAADSPGSPPPPAGDSWVTIQSDILQARCVPCHNNTPAAPMGLSWEADQYDRVVTAGRLSRVASSLRIIEPGDSAASYMYWKINGQGPNGEAIEGARMPFGGPYLDQAQIDRIAAWIDAGAPAQPPGAVGPDPSLKTFEVDQSGATLEYRSTEYEVSLTLTIPPGALAAGTEITIQHARTFPAASGLMQGAIFELGPDDLVFDAPVELRIAYAVAMRGTLPGYDLRIHKATAANWVPLLGLVENATRVVGATLTEFSTYGLKAIPPLTSGSGDDDGADNWGKIQADILQPWCVPCHNNTPAAAVRLSFEADQYDTLVTDGRMNQGSMANIYPMLLIDPGNSAGSFIIWKLNGLGSNNEVVGLRMPASGPPFLSQQDIDRVAAWIDAGAPGGGVSVGTPGSIVPTWYGVQANILEMFCTLCHSGDNPPEGLSWELDQYDVVVTNQRPSSKVSSMALVQPGDPDASYMYWKITGDPGISGVRMPATGVPLDQESIDVVRQWILDGAPLGNLADADVGRGGDSALADFPAGSWMYVWNESLRVCTQCHRLTPANPGCGVDFVCPAKGVVLSADNYLGVVDDAIVQPLSLDNSKLWQRVTENDPSKRMPLGLEPLTQQQLEIIQDWILDGAPFCPSGEVCP